MKVVTEGERKKYTLGKMYSGESDSQSKKPSTLQRAPMTGKALVSRGLYGQGKGARSPITEGDRFRQEKERNHPPSKNSRCVTSKSLPRYNVHYSKGKFRKDPRLGLEKKAKDVATKTGSARTEKRRGEEAGTSGTNTRGGMPSRRQPKIQRTYQRW